MEQPQSRPVPVPFRDMHLLQGNAPGNFEGAKTAFADASDYLLKREVAVGMGPLASQQSHGWTARVLELLYRLSRRECG